MKPYTLVILVLFGQLAIGQNRFVINYPNPTTFNINYQDTIQGVFEVGFFNQNNQVIKSISRTKEENHSSKKGYNIYNSITYYFYQDSLLIKQIAINLDNKTFSKTDYFYNENKMDLGWENFSIKPKISKDSFNAIIKKDCFLNFPNLFPTRNLTLETRQVRKYENNNLVYKCYYERYGKLKTAVAAREHIYKYNAKGQLIEHISNPKSDAGGTAFLKSTYEYNSENNVFIEQSYSDGKHQSTSEYIYSDSTILRTTYFLDDNGKIEYYYRDGVKEPNAIKRLFIKAEDGNFYDEYGTIFSLGNKVD